MSTRTLAPSGRLTDSSVVTAIFAPRYHNHTAISVTTGLQGAYAHVSEFPCYPDDFVTRRVFENLHRVEPELRGIAGEYLRAYLEQWFTTVTLKSPRQIPQSPLEAVPIRTFPFASHLNLLALPEVEGVFLDPDDFTER